VSMRGESEAVEVGIRPSLPHKGAQMTTVADGRSFAENY